MMTEPHKHVSPGEGEKKDKHDTPDARLSSHGIHKESSKAEVAPTQGSEGHHQKHKSGSPPVRPPSSGNGHRHASTHPSPPQTPAAPVPAAVPVLPPHKLPSASPVPDVKVRLKSTESQQLEKAVKISDVVKIPVPKVIVCRIFGVTSSESVGELVYKYFVMKVPLYLNEHWADANVQEAVTKIRDGIEEAKIKDFHPIPAASESKEKIIDAIVKFVEVMSDPRLDSQKKKTLNPPFIRLRSLITSAGMRSKDIDNSHVYDDIPPAFKVWTESGIRIVTISSTTKDAQKDYMTYTNHGDMTPFISDQISLMNPHLQTADPKSPEFRNMCKKVLQVEPTSVLLLTSKISEAKAAQKCSMEVVLICREERIGKKPVSEIKRESVKDIHVVKSMQAIVLVNK
jgi:methionine salvage enolase-phosphatase E1